MKNFYDPNLSGLLQWAIKNHNDHNCRVIADAIISGNELCAGDLVW